MDTRAIEELAIDEEITQFVATDYRRVLAYLVILCGSVPAAEDALQEALARAWDRSQRGEKIDSLEGWVIAVARNLTRSAARRWFAEIRARDRLATRILLSQDQADSEAQRVSDRLAVLAAIKGLTAGQREAIGLRYFADYSVGEVGKIMGLDEGAVGALLFRARRALKGSLDPDVVQGGPDARHR